MSVKTNSCVRHWYRPTVCQFYTLVLVLGLMVTISYITESNDKRLLKKGTPIQTILTKQSTEKTNVEKDLAFHTAIWSITKEMKNRTVPLLGTGAKHNFSTFKSTSRLPVYIFSAFVESIPFISGRGQSENTSKHQNLTLNVWQSTGLLNESFLCCYAFKNKTFFSIPLLAKRHSQLTTKAKLQASQFICQHPGGHVTSDLLGITLTLLNNSCPDDPGFYHKLISPESSANGIAVCSKLAYGNLSADNLVEWFEIHRLLGVKKVLVYTHNLNEKARRIFKYYESAGLVEIVPFDFPEKDSIRRSAGMKTNQAWSDEQVAVFDCQQRLQGYQWVAVVDTDEYIIPEKYDNWHQLLDNLKKNDPRAASFAFYVTVHVTSWGKTWNTSDLYVTQYLNRTVPFTDRMKYIYRPPRVRPGTVSTHNLMPQMQYYSAVVKAKDAVLHHYRGCRKEWLEKKAPKTQGNSKYRTPFPPKDCWKMRRFPDNTIKRFAEKVKDSVNKIKTRFGLRIPS